VHASTLTRAHSSTVHLHISAVQVRRGASGASGNATYGHPQGAGPAGMGHRQGWACRDGQPQGAVPAGMCRLADSRTDVAEGDAHTHTHFHSHAGQACLTAYVCAHTSDAHLKQLYGQRSILVCAQRLQGRGQQRSAAHLHKPTQAVAHEQVCACVFLCVHSHTYACICVCVQHVCISPQVVAHEQVCARVLLCVRMCMCACMCVRAACLHKL